MRCPMPLPFHVGQPILAAAGFQPAFTQLPKGGCLVRKSAYRPKEPPKRRLQARLPAPPPGAVS
jgi:hypothetical protein